MCALGKLVVVKAVVTVGGDGGDHGVDAADQVGATGSGVLVGRFAFDGDFDLSGSELFVTWNQGLGTPGNQAGFIVNVPAPGAMALLGLAGLTGRRRRNG